MSELPQPPYGPEVDVRDVPIPRDLFAGIAASTFKMSFEDARAQVDRIADAIEREERRRPCRSL